MTKEDIENGKENSNMDGVWTASGNCEPDERHAQFRYRASEILMSR
jgi:hypothetical protein